MAAPQGRSLRSSRASGLGGNATSLALGARERTGAKPQVNARSTRHGSEWCLKRSLSRWGRVDEALVCLTPPYYAWTDATPVEADESGVELTRTVCDLRNFWSWSQSLRPPYRPHRTQHGILVPPRRRRTIWRGGRDSSRSVVLSTSLYRGTFGQRSRPDTCGSPLIWWTTFSDSQGGKRGCDRRQRLQIEREDRG